MDRRGLVCSAAGFAAMAALALSATASAAPFGASDDTFSGDGWIALPAGHDYRASANSLAVQPDGKIVSGGWARVGGVRRFALTRHAGTGPIDTGFGDQGKVTTKVGNTDNAQIDKVLVLPGGSMLAIGVARVDNIQRVAFARYTSTGALDTGYGDQGIVLSPEFGDGVVVSDAALAADGDVLVTGQARDGAAFKTLVMRRQADGAPDATFGDAGQRLLVIGDQGCSSAGSVLERPAGEIVLIGRADYCVTGQGATAVTRLASNGARDPSFGTNGSVVFKLPTTTGFNGAATYVGPIGTGGIVDHAGRFVIYGSTTENVFGYNDPVTAVIRLTPAGALDTGFDSDGFAIMRDECFQGGLDVDELGDGRLFVTAVGDVGSLPILGAWGLGMLKEDGTPDTAFYGPGAFCDQIGSGQTINSEAPAETVVDGNTLVVAGNASTTIFGGNLTEDDRFGLRRYTDTGLRDPGFNAFDEAATQVGLTTSTTPTVLAPQPDGSLFLAGHAVEHRNLVSAIWKLTATGALDATWSADGVVIEALGVLGSQIGALVPAAPASPQAGKIYSGGFANEDYYYDTFMVMRHTATGALDTSFSSDGVLFIKLRALTMPADVAPTCAGTPSVCRDDDGTTGDGGEINQLIPLADGGVLAVGQAGDRNSTRGGSDDDRIAVAKILPDGTPDAAFGTGGVVQYYRADQSGSGAQTAALVAGNKLRIATVFADAVSATDDILALLQIDAATGALDTGFDGDGYAALAAPAGTHYLRGHRTLVDGTMLLSAYTLTTPPPRLIGRITPAGAMDATFGSGGFATFAPPAAYVSDGIDRLSDGRIVIGAGLSTGFPITLAATAIDPSGALATDFGTGGVLSTARSCGFFRTNALAVDAAGKLLVTGAGSDPALGGAAGLARYTSGSPSAPIGCPPTTGSAFISTAAAAPYTCTPSGFDGSLPLTYTYKWLREATVIDGATDQTYVPVDADAGHLLACRARAANPYGSLTAVSNGRRVPGTLFVEPETPGPGPVATVTPTPETPAPPVLPPTTTPPVQKPPPVVVKPPAIKPAAVFTLPSVKKCVSRRVFRIRLKQPKGTKLVSAVVLVNGKKVKTVKGKKLTAPVDLRGLPKGRFTVKVTATTADGRSVTETRKYKTCKPKKKRK